MPNKYDEVVEKIEEIIMWETSCFYGSVVDDDTAAVKIFDYLTSLTPDGLRVAINERAEQLGLSQGNNDAVESIQPQNRSFR